MYLNIRNGTSQLIIFRFSIIKKSERIYLDNPIKGLDIFIKYIGIYKTQSFCLSVCLSAIEIKL